MALASNALITVNEFKYFAKIVISDTSRDAEIESFINESSQLIETYCNRFFREKTITERVDGDGGNYILFKQPTVTNITSIHEDSSRVFDASSLLDSSRYELDLDERQEGIGVVKYDNSFPSGIRNIEIIYNCGYPTTDDVPADIKLACKVTASYYFYVSENREFVSSSKSKGDETISLIMGIPERAAVIMDNYKRLEGY